MIVLKFGGTSVGSAEAILKVKTILLNESRQKIIVCSAMSGVTDQLIELSSAMQCGNLEKVSNSIEKIQNKHFQLIEQLTRNSTLIQNTHQKIEAIFNKIDALINKPFQESFHSMIITSGELLSTTIISIFLMNEGLPNVLLMAEDFMNIRSPLSPDIESVKKKINYML